MSFRAIEMQVALPRTQDVGKIQEQLQQRGQATQNQLADEQKKLDELHRNQVSTSDETEKSKLEKERQDQKKREQDRREQQARAKKKEAEKEPHPYKGKFVDFSG